MLSLLAVLSLQLDHLPKPDHSKTYAIENVSVIPMDRERVLRDQTVVIQNGAIAEIVDSIRAKVPAGAVRIDGKGKFLIPGLMDMHVHLFSDDGFPKDNGPDELAINVANGVTTVRLMCGTPEQLDYRSRIRAGQMFGPSLWVASPQLTGRANRPNSHKAATPEEGREAVRKSKAAGYDFIKLTEVISPEVYDAVIDEAKKEKIRVIGHVDTRVGAPKAIASGQQIEHLDAYMESVLRDDSPIKTSVSDRGIFRPENWESLDYIDDAKIVKIARDTARAGIYSTPTLNFWQVTFGVGASDDEIRARPDFRFTPPNLVQPWFDAGHRIWATPKPEERRKKFIRARNMIVREIRKAGGKIMAGSDSPDWFMLYGWSLHRELRVAVPGARGGDVGSGGVPGIAGGPDREGKTGRSRSLECKPFGRNREYG
jgi:imidazolonepropionase-like amidohydrolase